MAKEIPSTVLPRRASIAIEQLKERAVESPTTKPPPPVVTDEEALQKLTIMIPFRIYRQLHGRAFAERTSMKGAIMGALREAGYEIRDEDLIDKRRA